MSKKSCGSSLPGHLAVAISVWLYLSSHALLLFSSPNLALFAIDNQEDSAAFHGSVMYQQVGISMSPL